MLRWMVIKEKYNFDVVWVFREKVVVEVNGEVWMAATRVERGARREDAETRRDVEG